MNIKQIQTFLILLIIFAACGHKEMNTPKNAMNKFEQFKRKVKFTEEYSMFYPGIANPALRPILTTKINKVADNFENVAQSKNPTDEMYQKQIRIGLDDFADVYMELDTEDRERVCKYFEELMDIVELESSDGLLNNFMYGFDPNDINKQ